MKLNSQSINILKDEIKKQNQLKKDIKNHLSQTNKLLTRVMKLE
jgi:hypothetical protein